MIVKKCNFSSTRREARDTTSGQKKTRFQSLPALPGGVPTTFHEFANHGLLVGGLRGRSSGLAFSLLSAPAELYFRDVKSHHSALACTPLLASAKTVIVGTTLRLSSTPL